MFILLQFYIKGGYLLPKFHMSYWLGFNTTSWPSFTQIDRTFRAPYRNWGTHVSAAGARVEPNNLNDPEWCLATNYSQALKNAWGYMDTSCNTKYIFMCRNISELPSATSPCMPGTLGLLPHGDVLGLLCSPWLHRTVSRQAPFVPAHAAACGLHNYTSPLTNYTYYLNNCNNATFDASEAVCNDNGGHLVSYSSADEQQDAEGYFYGLGGCFCGDDCSGCSHVICCALI